MSGEILTKLIIDELTHRKLPWRGSNIAHAMEQLRDMSDERTVRDELRALNDDGWSIN